jgi:hypothetical protein
MVGTMHSNFCCCCSMRDARVKKRFFIDLSAMFWQKGALTLDLGKYCLYLFLHESIKLGSYTRTNLWPCIPWMYWATNI